MDTTASPMSEAGVPDAEEPKGGLAGWLGRPVLLEARSPFELRALRRHPLWTGRGIPDGRGRPLLIIPGFLASRSGADALVHVTRQAGWHAKIADVGRNSGPAYLGLESSSRDLHRMTTDHDHPVTIVGHSRGGQFARILAVRHPELVAQIVVLGAPLLVKYPRFAPVRIPIEMLEITWRRGAFGPVRPDRELEVDEDRFRPFPSSVDFVSIYTRTDGIVDWRASLDPAAEAVEVAASHTGLISSVAGIGAIAQALARQG